MHPSDSHLLTSTHTHVLLFLHPHLPSQIPLPSHWAPQSSSSLLVPLNRDEAEWREVASLFQDSLPAAVISNIERVQVRVEGAG
jgi:hypothetical protein